MKYNTSMKISTMTTRVQSINVKRSKTEIKKVEALPEENPFQTDDTPHFDDPYEEDNITFKDPNDYKPNEEGLISFSRFSRLMVLCQTANQMYNFFAKIYPSPDPNLTDSEYFAKTFNVILKANQVYYAVHDNKNEFKKEVDLLFEKADIIGFGVRDAIEFFGFDKLFADIYKKQSTGGELFNLLLKEIQDDVEEFRLTTKNMINAIRNLLNPQQYILAQIKIHQTAYLQPNAFETDSQKIEQGKKMLQIFVDLKISFDSFFQDISIGMKNGLHTKTKIASNLKKMAQLKNINNEKEQQLIEFHIPREDNGEFLDLRNIELEEMEIPQIQVPAISIPVVQERKLLLPGTHNSMWRISLSLLLVVLSFLDYFIHNTE